MEFTVDVNTVTTLSFGNEPQQTGRSEASPRKQASESSLRRLREGQMGQVS